MVDKLVKEHNKTPEEVYETNYIDCLNWLSCYKQKEEYLQKIQKKK